MFQSHVCAAGKDAAPLGNLLFRRGLTTSNKKEKRDKVKHT